MVARLIMAYIWTKTVNMLADIGTKFVSQAVYKVLVPRMRGLEPIMPMFGKGKRPRDET